MGKKSKRTKSQQSSNEEAPRPSPADRTREEKIMETKDNLQFEDPFVEEYIKEDEDDEGWENYEDDEAMDGEIVRSWNPLTGGPLGNGEKLEMDPSAYKMHHALSTEWPSLSFDFVRDDCGESRTRFPHSLIAATGTQADRPDNNQLSIIKLSDLARIHAESDDDILGEEYNAREEHEEGEDDESEADEYDLDPVIEHFSIKHYGGVNRVRVMPQQSNIVATWSDEGRVNIFDTTLILERLSLGNHKAASPASPSKDLPTKPSFCYSKHKTEGYAMDWSSIKQGSFLSGDCNGCIHLWSQRPEGGYIVTPSYKSNPSDRPIEASPSVEDLQWSPTEATVFASAECGGFVRIFDTRVPNKAMLSHKIHPNSGADVNVLSWNKLVSNLLATGGDDGVLSVWDLRHFSSAQQPLNPLARFTSHKTPITSVEWHPTDESMLAVSDDVGAYIYDLSVEEDDATEKQLSTDVPPQLLFVHCGSEQFKEVHWHPQIVSCVMTTALSGFSVFIPSNL